jgi:sugar lactone lactonase YvrE
MKKNLLFLLALAVLIISSCNKENLPNNYSGSLTSGNVTIIAGSGGQGSGNGTGENASFDNPTSLALDTSGNIYVADYRNNLIRKVTAAGVVTTLAGTGVVGDGNGAPSVATFSQPIGIATDKYGNVYVADSNNNLIREISVSGVVSTFAGTGVPGAVNGTASTATFNYPEGLAVDTLGNVYVADYGNNLIREISSAGMVTTLAGDGGQGAVNGLDTAAMFNEPTAIAVDVSGNVYVSDFGNNMIRKISVSGGVTTLAGSGSTGVINGTGSTATFNGPTGVAVDASGNVYAADYGNNVIREITPAGAVTTLAGAGASGTSSQTYTFNGPYGIALDVSGNIYVALYGNSTIVKVIRATDLAERSKRLAKK